MSATYLYTVSPNGPLTLHEEFRNSHRGAMWIWMRLREKFHPDHVWPENAPYDDPRVKEASKWIMKYDDIWALSKDSRLCRNEKIVLMSTYDNVMVKRKNFEELITAFRWFADNYGTESAEEKEKRINWKAPEKPKDGQWSIHDMFSQTPPLENHSLNEQAVVIEKLKDNKKVYAICWNQTSVNGDAWITYIPKKDEHRSYNIKKDKGHWFLFDDLA